MSLDEEEGESEGLEDINLNYNTQEKQSLRFEWLGEDGSDSQLIVNKMTKVFKQGRLQSGSRDEKVKLAASDIFACKEDLLSIMKDYFVKQGITLRKVRNDRKKYTQQYSHLGCTFRLHSSVLVDKITWMIRSIKGSYVCLVSQENKVTSSS